MSLGGGGGGVRDKPPDRPDPAVDAVLRLSRRGRIPAADPFSSVPAVSVSVERSR